MVRLIVLAVSAAPLFAAPVPKTAALKPEQFTERRIQLLRRSAVQKELGLSAEQRIALIDHFEAVDEIHDAEVSGLYPPSAPPEVSEEDEEKKRLQAGKYATKRTAKSMSALSEIVTAPQFTRLLELERRYLGPFAFQDKDVATDLALTPAQAKTVAQAVEGFRKAYEEGYGPRVKPTGRPMHEAAKPTTEAILKALTPEQAARWKELIGAMPKIATLGHSASRQAIMEAAAKTFERPDEK